MIDITHSSTVVINNSINRGFFLILSNNITRGRPLHFICQVLLATSVLLFLINAVRFNWASVMHLQLCGHPGPEHVQFVNRQTNHKVCVKNNCGFAVKEPLLEQAFAQWNAECVCEGVCVRMCVWVGVQGDTCGVNCIFHSSSYFKGLRWEWKLPYVTFETNWISALLCMGQ